LVSIINITYRGNQKMTLIAIGNECDFVSLAKSSYGTADNVVRVLTRQRRLSSSQVRVNMNALRSNIQSIENNLWEALARDYPRFRFRRQNQTIVLNYYGDGRAVYINPGEVYKIKAWGVNDYYEALDTINRLQNRIWSNSVRSLDRRWQDDWRRLDKQLATIDRRNCKGFPEVIPGPIIVQPPICLPKPPSPPGPVLPIFPCPPVPSQGVWSSNDKRNWSVIGWDTSDLFPAIYGFTINRPSVNIINGREFIFYRTPGTNPTKILWLFHGAGGSARSWFTDYEKVKYLKKFIDAGYAVAAYESYNRISRKWTLTVNPTTNREIIGLRACQSYLSSLGILPSNQYGVGMSAGGAMVSYAAGQLGLTKIVIHNAAGVNSIIRNASYNAKTLWMVSTNDVLFNNTEASDNYNYLLTNRPDLTPAYYNQAGTKITSAIFDDIPGISTVVADAIISGLVSGGFIESGGALTSKYSSATRAIRDEYLQNTIPVILITAFSTDQETYRKYANDIIDQIKISFSDHEFSGWQRTESAGSLVLTDRDLAFLNS
jgi:hypothetical protein